MKNLLRTPIAKIFGARPNAIAKDCPFCKGERVSVIQTTINGNEVYTVQCLDCEAHGPTSANPVDAMIYWNQE